MIDPTAQLIGDQSKELKKLRKELNDQNNLFEDLSKIIFSIDRYSSGDSDTPLSCLREDIAEWRMRYDALKS